MVSETESGGKTFGDRATAINNPDDTRPHPLVDFALDGVNDLSDGEMKNVFGPVRPEDPRTIGDTVVDVLSRISSLSWVGFVAAVIS